MATIANLLVNIDANSAQLVREVKNVQGSLDSMEGFASKAGRAIGGAFTVGAVIAFGKSVVDTASDIRDMAAKIGISTDAVQGLKFAAEQTGSTLDAVGTAITRMNKNLVGGDKATVGALKEIGLDFTAIRGMKPEDAFLAIADAIQKVPDPMIQSHAALTIFGKSAAELLPGMKEGFRGLADSADKMSEDTIRALEEAQDAWERLSNKVTIITGNLIGLTLNAAKQTTTSWASFLNFSENVIKHGVGTAIAMANAQEKSTNASIRNKDVNLALEPAVVKTESAVKKSSDAHDRHAKSADAATVATKAFGVAVDQNMIPQVRTLGTEIEVSVSQLTALGDAIAHVQGLSKGGIIPDAPARLGVDVGLPTAPAFGEIGKASGVSFGAAFKASASGAFGNLGGALNHAIANATSVGGALKGFATNVAKDFVGTALSFIPVIGPMLSELAGPIVDGFKKLFNRSQGRDIVKEFAEGLGGFDALHKQLNGLGDEGERLWITLTQGVGRNNKDQARAAVEEVTAALEKHKTAQEGVQTAAVAANAAQIAAYEKAKDAVSTLDNQIKTLSDSIAGEAPEEFMGIVEMQTRARIDGLTKEREAAQSALEEMGRSMADSIDGVREAIERLPEKISLELDIHGRGYSGSTEAPEGFAGGTPNLDYRSFGQRRTVDLHGDEAVIPKSGAGQLASQIAAALAPMLGGGGAMTLSAPDIARFLRGEIVKVTRMDAATGGLRPRAAAGRSS